MGHPHDFNKLSEAHCIAEKEAAAMELKASQGEANQGWFCSFWGLR